MRYQFSFNDNYLLNSHARLKQLAERQAPLRSELYDMDRMSAFSRHLGRTHKLAAGNNIADHLKRLSNNEAAFQEVHDLLMKINRLIGHFIHENEWRTNMYVVRNQIRKIRALFGRVDERLPRLQHEFSKGTTRVYALCEAFVSHTNSQVDLDNLRAFIKDYQTESSLRLEELKAVPAMLRLALVENLLRIAIRKAIAGIDAHLAAQWERRIAVISRTANSLLDETMNELLKLRQNWKSNFIATLIRKLQKNTASMAVPLAWIEERLTENEMNGREVEEWARQEQNVDQVSFRNAISSLRILDTVDWYEFVGATSVVEQILCKDESGIYPLIDPYTRDYYRIKVSLLASKTRFSEPEIARKAVLLARNAARNNKGPDASHVGFFLAGDGQRALLASLGVPALEKWTFRKLIERYPVSIYLFAFGLITFAIAAGIFFNVRTQPGMILPVWILLLLCSSELSRQIIEAMSGLLNKSTLLPRMDFSKYLPREYRTLVVIPSLLTNEKELDELMHALEVRFLGNRHENLHFGLLTDFRDAHQETLHEDELLLELAVRKTRDLNKKYCSETNNIFFLFHRPRKWNASEKVWMGYERKRGKLMDLNAFLRGSTGNIFSHVIGNKELFPEIRYVITLDADTQLPRDAAWKMIGAMAHPLNRAVYSEEKRRVVAGYGILQPLIGTDLSDTDQSPYQHLTENGPDVNPYTLAMPDIYQDLFGESSFVGKGIYDIDIALKVLDKRLPENRILSHDLLEGCYLRCGLLNDVKLYERTSSYLANVKRRHRWIRGDWQIARWAGPSVPEPNGGRTRNPLSTLSRWKIFDNLRISLLSLASLVLLLLAWTVLKQALFWTIFVLLIILSPALVMFAEKLLRKPQKFLSWRHLKRAGSETTNRFILNIFDLICLPFEAFYTLDAILRTGWRMFVSHRNLLEWMPSRNLGKKASGNILQVYLTMWPGPVLGLLVFVYLSVFQPFILLWVFPLLMLWMASPFAVWRLNHSTVVQKKLISPSQQVFLRKLARKNWAYFEDFVNKSGNWLPPDHYQEYPKARVAEYTSPTNIGLALLAGLTASDFGYITTGGFITFTANIMKTMGYMERCKGHFYNWYNIHSLEPSEVRYVSTVDSGNLAGHLLVLQQALDTISGEKIVSSSLFRGIRDTLELLKEGSGMSEYSVDPGIADRPDMPGLYEVWLATKEIITYIEEISIGTQFVQGSDADHWFRSLERQCRNIMDELRLMAPWLWLPPAPDECRRFIPKNIPTLDELFHIAASTLKETANAELLESKEEMQWMYEFRACMEKTYNAAKERLETIDALIRQCTSFADMEYEFLYNQSEQLLAIGHHEITGIRDANCYDMLASEARLATFVAICQDKLPVKSWFALGRPLVDTGELPVMLSANGTMFEYLMPLLVMPTFKGTLLDLSYKAAVQKQIDYSKKMDIPWGISEAGYSALDTSLNYQYKVFGVPTLSLKHNYSEDDKVIAPYASALALMVSPEEATRNLEVLKTKGFEGRYGFFEAIDYNSSRILNGQSYSVVRSFMVHHQGMSLLALAYLLLGKPMQKRFSASPVLESSLLLLQEQIPQDTILHIHQDENAGTPDKKETIFTENDEVDLESLYTAVNAASEVQLLSNGRYHVMVTPTGKSYSRWENILLTRYREDGNTNGGICCYIRDVETGAYWPTTYEPLCRDIDSYETAFSVGNAAFRRYDNNLEAITCLAVSPVDDMEIRQVKICNHSDEPRTIEVNACLEVLLVPLQEYQIPLMNIPCDKEAVPGSHAILCSRKPSGQSGRIPYLFFRMTLNKENVPDACYDTRLTTISYRMVIGPHETILANLYLGIGEDRSACMDLLQRCQHPSLPEKLFRQARTHNLADLKKIGVTEEDMRQFREFTCRLVSDDNASLAIIQDSVFNLSDKELTVLLRIKSSAHIETVVKVIQMHAYWRLKGLSVTLVIWNEDKGSYANFLQKLIMEFITSGIGAESLNRHEAGIFVRTGDKINDSDLVTLQNANLIIEAEKWDLRDYGRTIGRQLKEAPGFSNDFHTDSAAIIINEPTVKYMDHEKRNRGDH